MVNYKILLLLVLILVIPAAYSLPSVNDAVVYYSFDSDNSSSITARDSAGNFDMTLFGGAFITAGLLNEGVRLDGVNDAVKNVTFFDKDSNENNNLTYTTWIFPHSNQTADNLRFFRWEETGSWGASNWNFDSTNDRMEVDMGCATGGSTGVFTNAMDVSDEVGIWNHWTLKMNNTGTFVYRNGIFNFSGTSCDPGNGDTIFTIGANNAGTQNANATFDEFAIWNISGGPTDQDILDLVNAGVGNNPFKVVAPGDTCTYTSGDFDITLEDNCVIDSNVDVGSNAVRVTGDAGTLTIASGGNLQAKEFHFTPDDFDGDSIFSRTNGGTLTIKK